MMRWMMVVWSVGLVGCADDESVIEVVDTGRACLLASPSNPEPAQQFVAGRPAFVSYGLKDVCLSYSCSVERFGSCTVQKNGGAFAVRGVFRWVDLSGGGAVCTDDCSGIVAICETEPLAEGTYEFGFAGAATLALTVPSQLAAPPCQDVTAASMP